MYEVKKRRWVFEGDEKLARESCARAAQTEDTETLFEAADYLLSQAERGDKNADAVYCMERAAKAGHSQALLAMGQMAEYGWAVGKSKKYARRWYEAAAKAGNEEARKALRRMKRQRRIRCIGALLICLAIVGAVLASLSYRSKLSVQEEEQGQVSGRGEVLVGKDTQLKETNTLEEFNESMRSLLEEYDDELVVAGQRSTNRLILHFEGKSLNLTDFLAKRVIARENNMVIIQFDSEEEARQCLESLEKMKEVTFVEMDEYDVSSQTAGEGQNALSQNSGRQSYTWGCQDMGMDQLADYLAGHARQQSATVAVVDTGVLPAEAMKDRVLAGTDVVVGGDGRMDTVGHGTHVAGTILDCTQGLDVKVLPVGVFGANALASTTSICTGLEYAISQAPDVINMSLGGPAGAEHNWEQMLIGEAVQQGITVVVSAGNGDEAGNPEDTAGVMPAALTECIVVGAVDQEHEIASFSNYGDSVDVCAPGVDVVSYSIKPEGFESMSGTSMAAPHISALSAMLCMYVPEASPAQIEKYIKDYCERLGDEQYYGAGIPRGALYIEN